MTIVPSKDQGFTVPGVGTFTASLTQGNYAQMNSVSCLNERLVEQLGHQIDTLKALPKHRIEMNLSMPYRDKVTINGVEYDGIRIEVRPGWTNDDHVMRVYVRGSRVDKYNETLTDSARAKLEAMVSDACLKFHSEYAETLRDRRTVDLATKAINQLRAIEESVTKTRCTMEVRFVHTITTEKPL